MEQTIQVNKRICYACGLEKTYVDSNGYAFWHLNQPTDLVLCQNCHARIICYTKKGPANLKGEKHPMWKGGYYKHGSGYIQIWKRDHPYADTRGYVMEHRLVMEKQIGRYLTPDEDVHHINSIRDDNRIENLKVLSRNEHQLLHHLVDMTNRTCTNCSNSQTYINKRNGRPRWFYDSVTEALLCNKCACKEYRERKRFYKRSK